MSSTINVSKKCKWDLGDIEDIEDDFTGNDFKANTSTSDAPDELNGGGSLSDEQATEERADNVACESANKDSFNIRYIIDVDHLDLCDTLSDKPVMSLLTQCSHIPSHFHLSITFPLLQIPQPHDTPL